MQYVKSSLPHLVTYDISNNNVTGNFMLAMSNPKLEYLSISNNNFHGQIIDQGVLVDFAAFKVRVIRTDGNHLVGSNVMQIYRFLPDLEVINGTGNHFNGEFKDTLTHCKNLTHIAFGGMDMYGTLPSGLGILSKLVEIDMRGNSRMAGTIPSELSRLTRLDISGTSLSGSIPAEFCSRMEDGLMEVIADCSNNPYKDNQVFTT